jgi:hypothetical protein
MSAEIPINPYLTDAEHDHDPDSSTTATARRDRDKNTFVQATITSYDQEDLKDDTL